MTAILRKSYWILILIALASNCLGQALPSVWTQQDIGSPSPAGNATYANGAFTVGGSGSVGSTADATHFVYQAISGDGTIIARVPSAQTAYYPQLGLMVRETLQASSKEVAVWSSSQLTYRSSTGGGTSYQYGPTAPATPWLKLVRSGNVFTGYISSNAVDWSQVGSVTVTMASTVYVGMFAGNGYPGILETVVFDNVSLSSSGATAPVITAISSTTGAIGGQVTITGSGFGSSANGSAVLLNNAPMTLNSWNDTSITFTIAAGATSGFLNVAVAPSMNSSNAVPFTITSQPLPTTVLDQDVGSPNPVGSATYSNGSYTIKGSGSVGSTADHTHFVYQALSGDGTIIARVASIPSATGYSQVGLMVRETMQASSTEVSVWNASYLNSRATTGGSTSFQYGPTAPSSLCWLKLIRSGNVFTGYISGNGLDWLQVGTSVTIAMASTAYFGMFVGNSYPGVLQTAVFDSLSISSGSITPPVINTLSATTASIGSQVTLLGAGFGATQNGSAVVINGAPMTISMWSDTAITFTIPTGTTSGLIDVLLAPTMNASNSIPFAITAQPLPSPWLNRDIGTAFGATGAGSATYANGVFSLTSGGQIGGTADKGHFVYQTLTGDGSIMARVTSYQQTGSQNVGLMIRETLNSGSKSVFVEYIPNASYLLNRATTGGSTSSQTGSGPSTQMYWLKLIRNGNTFTGLICSDGGNWIQVGTPVTVAMASNVYIGMAVNVTATFDNLSLTGGTTPYVAGVSPSTAGAGQAVTISGSNFGASAGSSSIKFNGVAATSITSWSDTQIVALVPSTVATGSGPLTVTVNSITSNANVMFMALNPIITAVSPPAGAVNGTVTVTGTGFSNWGQVNINSQAVNINTWTSTSITFTVPSGATSGPLTVNLSGFASNPVSFTVESQPAISLLLPATGYIDSTTTITGSGFGASQSNSTVNFNGVNAAVTNWTDTAIDVIVPYGTSTGPVGVTVANLSAQGPQFVVRSMVQVTDSAGNLTNYTFTMQGGTWHTVASQGSGCSSCTVRGTTVEDYDGVGNLLHETDALGHTISYAYDGNNNLTSQSEPLNTTTNVNWIYTYNSFGEVLTATDPLGNVTTNTYDTHGNLLTVTTPKPDAPTAASVTQFGYNPLGELTTITDPLNHVTTLTYTPAGLIHTINDAQNNVTTYGYDAHGNRTSVTDAMQHQTTFAYDAGDRLTTITYPDQTTTVFGYDTRGRRTSVTDQNGKQTTYAYDDADRLTSVTDAALHVTQYAYDDENNLSSITDANTHTTAFIYDNLGRVKETDFPSGHAETYLYDVIGNLTSKTDRNGNTITYVYDALNRLTHKGYPDSTGVDYVYDLVGKIKQATDPTGTYGFAYDNMGRLIGTTTQYTFLAGQTYSNSYTYDAASNRTGFTAPDGSTNTYVYDTLNRLSTLTNSVTGQFGFGYDALSRRTSLTRPNNVNTNYTYDNLSRLLSVLHQNGPTTIDGATYTLDNAGNRTSKVNQLNGVTENYTYDPIYQLTQVQQVVSGNSSTSESYTYDPVGNRLSALSVSSYTYNNSNQLTSSSDGYSYTYDFNGNTLTKSNSSGTTQYAWAFENRLTGVTLPNGGGTVSFRYDPFGRRIQKSAPSGLTNYLYDGVNSIEELDGGGATLSRYARGAGIEETLGMERSGVTSFFSEDGLGSVTSLTDTGGSVSASYAFGSFGNQTVSSGSISSPFRYTARELDSETGLLYLHARYYDPSAGRFLSEDPIAFRADSNFYRYSSNSPISLVDPLGLADITYNIDKQNHGWGSFQNGMTWFNGAGDPPSVWVSCNCDGKGKYRMSTSVTWDIHITYGTQGQLAEENEHAQIFMDYMNSRKPFYEQQFETTVYSSEEECRKARWKVHDAFDRQLMEDLHHVNTLENQHESVPSKIWNAIYNFFTK